MRLAYLAPDVLRHLTCGRESPAVSPMSIVDITAEPWLEQPEKVFG